MPLLSDVPAIRAMLQRDPAWAVYALGDMEPGAWERCEWRVSTADAGSLLLLYHGLNPPVLWAGGSPQGIAEALSEIDARRLDLHVKPEVLKLLPPRYRVMWWEPVWRMVLDRDDVHLTSSRGVRRLDVADAAPVAALYADGAETGEAPPYFADSMLASGVFWGVDGDDGLVAVAGTHVVSLVSQAAAIGNVYTRRDHRGRGLAAAVTSAVTQELLDTGFQTIALNVVETNTTAERVYARLGFRRHCRFVQGIAERVV